MQDGTPSGTSWTDHEISVIISQYFEMLDRELRAESFVKAEYNARVRNVTGRSKRSIEYKFQNISAVLAHLGLPWVLGYKPMANYQGKLLDAVDRLLDARNGMGDLVRSSRRSGLLEDGVLFMEEAPRRSQNAEEIPGRLHALVRKFDPAARDARNRELGRQGEEHVLRSEVARLRQNGRSDLAQGVRWVARDDGDGAGYDIRSFALSGEERLLEVKTTAGNQQTPFFISANELELASRRSDAFRIVRIYDFLRQPRAFKLAPPLELAVNLYPCQFRAVF